jgi:hypothetical protein
MKKEYCDICGVEIYGNHCKKEKKLNWAKNIMVMNKSGEYADFHIEINVMSDHTDKDVCTDCAIDLINRRLK